MVLMVELDLVGAVVTLTNAQAEQILNAAAADAGRSDAHRDLSLLLTRALHTGKRVALQRGEKRALDEILAREEFDDLKAAINIEP